MHFRAKTKLRVAVATALGSLPWVHGVWLVYGLLNWESSEKVQLDLTGGDGRNKADLQPGATHTTT